MKKKIYSSHTLYCNKKKFDKKKALKAEEERIKRQQQYMGAAAGAVDEARAEELLKAKERKIRQVQIVDKTRSDLDKEVFYLQSKQTIIRQ